MSKMRLDKFLSNAKICTRSECVNLVKKHLITVNDILVKKKDILIDVDNDVVKVKGEIVKKVNFIYLMLNKPSGYVSSTNDPRDKTVLDLLSEDYRKFKLFPCGRLDKDTVGLIILTNDGKATHALLSPKHHVKKVYYFELADEISEEKAKSLEKGVKLADGYITKPCEVKMEGKTSGYITLTEGKYHEIKRMFATLSNKVIYLKRISFSSIILDKNLKEGEYRKLTDVEESVFKNIIK
ncbi:MAG: pseudouridine synthase [Christensenellales bacterium]